jgi:hypothetical protein
MNTKHLTRTPALSHRMGEGATPDALVPRLRSGCCRRMDQISPFRWTVEGQAEGVLS